MVSQGLISGTFADDRTKLYNFWKKDVSNGVNDGNPRIIFLLVPRHVHPDYFAGV